MSSGKMKRKTRVEQLQVILGMYEDEHGPGPHEHRVVAQWAINRGLIPPVRRDFVGETAKALSRAARQEYFTDEDGRRVRRRHVVKTRDEDGTQHFMWATIETATPKHMHVSLQQRRSAILQDCVQLDNDKDYFNDHNSHGAVIQLSFDFSEDVEEARLPTEYSDTRPDDDPIDDED